MNIKILKKDLQFGRESEDSNLKIIQEKFDSGIKKIKNNYFVFDYGCENCYVELKSRRCAHDTYPDTMVGKNKIDYARHTTRPCYFAFAFTDGIYYWKFNEDDITNGNVYFAKGGRTDRGKIEIKDYAYIKKEILTQI